MELEETINAVPCDVVVSGTPVDLGRILKANKPVAHVRYELDEIGHPNLEDYPQGQRKGLRHGGNCPRRLGEAKHGDDVIE